ncbi:hypothetical protein MHU86_24187 [Fragilaria crotonensis]|nr:hypothetical protein MHU86_24187 [Fragilaria crotonensis]
MQTVESHQHHEQYHRSMRMGAYHDADVNDPFVVRAVEFTKEALALQSPYPGIVLDETPNVTLQVESAEIQVVAGMNIRLTLQVMDGDECTRAFDVEIYDHFGDMTKDSNSEDPSPAKEEDPEDAHDSNDNAEDANDDAEEGNDDAGDVDDDTKEANVDAEEPNEEQILGDDVSADTDDDAEVEENN